MKCRITPCCPEIGVNILDGSNWVGFCSAEAFVDGSGGGNSSATPIAVTDFLHDRITRPT
jgi:hypothetical protein